MSGSTTSSPWPARARTMAEDSTGSSSSRSPCRSSSGTLSELVGDLAPGRLGGEGDHTGGVLHEGDAGPNGHGAAERVPGQHEAACPSASGQVGRRGHVVHAGVEVVRSSIVDAQGADAPLGEGDTEVVVEAPGRAEQPAHGATHGEQHPLGGGVAVPQHAEHPAEGEQLEVAQARGHLDLLDGQHPKCVERGAVASSAGAGTRPCSQPAPPYGDPARPEPACGLRTWGGVRVPVRVTLRSCTGDYGEGPHGVSVPTRSRCSEAGPLRQAARRYRHRRRDGGPAAGGGWRRVLGEPQVRPDPVPVGQHPPGRGGRRRAQELPGGRLRQPQGARSRTPPTPVPTLGGNETPEGQAGRRHHDRAGRPRGASGSTSSR